jgi:hypothetical protein
MPIQKRSAVSSASAPTKTDAPPPPPEAVPWHEIMASQHGGVPYTGPGTGGDTGTGLPPLAQESGVLNMDMNNSTDDIVALQDASTTAGVGVHLQIESEYMAIIDASDMSNLKVTRAVGGSTIAAHVTGTPVTVGVILPV